MYTATGQEQTAPRGQSFDVNRNVLSLHSIVATFKKMSPKSYFIHHQEIIRISCIVEKCWKIAFHLTVERKRSSVVVSSLDFSARGHGFDPHSRREKISVTEHAFLSFICRNDTRLVRRSGRDVNWRSPMQGESPHVQVKEPSSSFQSAKPVCTMYAWSLSSRDPSDRDVNCRPPVLRKVTPYAGERTLQ